MKRIPYLVRFILLYGLLLGGLVMGLRFLEFSFFAGNIGGDIYATVLSIVFMLGGIWLGFRLNASHKRKAEAAAMSGPDREAALENGLTQRELDVLVLIAGGLSNQEIADRLHVSLTTIKTHCSNIFIKLDVKRRTQAVQKAKNLKIIA